MRTAEELRRYGIHSLGEALNFLSLGMITESPRETVEIGARGVLLSGDYGNHVRPDRSPGSPASRTA